MARALVLETAEVRSLTFGIMQDVAAPGPVQHAGRTRRGNYEEWSISWGVNELVFNQFLLAHYEEHRRHTPFDVDFSDGRGPLGPFRYLAEPQFDCRGGSGAGIYSVAIRRDTCE